MTTVPTLSLGDTEFSYRGIKCCPNLKMSSLIRKNPSLLVANYGTGLIPVG